MPITSRRRQHSSEEDEAMDQVGPRQKMRKGGPTAPEISEIEERLENLILRVGEKSTSSLESNLEGLAQVLEADLNTYKTKILKILKVCIVGMPEKLTIYSTLVGLLNAKNYNFGGEFVEIILKMLRDLMLDSNFDQALFVVVFLCDLVNCRTISAHSCMGFLENFVDVALEPNIPQVRSDWFIYAVLHSLPWVGRELTERKPHDFNAMLERIQNHLETRQKLHVSMLRVWSSNRPHIQEEYLDSLWAQITKLRSENWEEKHINRHYVAFDASLCEALQHNLPSFVPVAHSPDAVYPMPTVVFRLFDYTDCPEDGPVLPGAHSIERFLIERDLEWLIQSNHQERKDCAAALLNYPRKNRVPLNYMILEVVFGQIFRLPYSPHLELFYGSLLIELCKLQPNSMPQVLAQAAELLYQRLDTMQPICIDRFVDWFSYHLSNFQFRWSWDDWQEALELDPLAPKRVFVREVLHKCIRLSYHQRIIDLVPSAFAPLIAEKPHATYKYTSEGAEALKGYSFAQQLTQMIRQKCSWEEALNLLQNCPTPSGGDSEMTEPGAPNLLAVEIFTGTLLNLGSKSFSHSFAALTRYHEVMKKLTAGSEEAQLTALRTLHGLWNTHPQMVCVLVDKFLKMQIVECNAVITWVFSDEMKDTFLRMWIWEVMQSALVKLSRHVQRLRNELQEAEEKLQQEGQMGEDSSSSVDRSAIDEMTEKLCGAELFQRNLLLSVFHKFTILLTEHLLSSEAEGNDFNTFWYRWVTGRFRHMFLAQHGEAAKQIDNLESFLFTSDIDPHILEIFHQFCALTR